MTRLGQTRHSLYSFPWTYSCMSIGTILISRDLVLLALDAFWGLRVIKF